MSTAPWKASLMKAAMGRNVSFGFARLTALAHATACVMGVLMLLLLPAVRSHHYAAHFRAPEVRRAAERQTFMAHTDNNAEEGVAQPSLLPRFFAATETSCKILPQSNFESPRQNSLCRVLNRWKLNRSSSSGPDPLLSV